MFATAVLNVGVVAILPPHTAAVAFVAWGVASKAALFGVQYAVYRARADRLRQG